MQALGDYIATLALAIWSVLTLDTRTATYLAVHHLNVEMAMAVAVIAGVSTLFGDSVVLFLNQVRGWRFLLSLLLNGLGFVVLYALQALVLAVVGPLVTGVTPEFTSVVIGVMLSTAPLVFGFLVLIPYFGPGIARVLQVWGLVILWVVDIVLFRAAPAPALLITAIGWGLMQVLSWSLSRPMAWLGDRLWRVLTGRSSMMTGRDLLSGHVFMPLESPVEKAR